MFHSLLLQVLCVVLELWDSGHLHDSSELALDVEAALEEIKPIGVHLQLLRVFFHLCEEKVHHHLFVRVETVHVLLQEHLSGDFRSFDLRVDISRSVSDFDHLSVRLRLNLLNVL